MSERVTTGAGVEPGFPPEWVEIAARAICVHDGDDWDDPAVTSEARAAELRQAYRAIARAVLAALVATDVLVTPPGPRWPADPVEPCDYTSTACQHGLHARCRLQRKFCPSRCGCPRHDDDTATCGALDPAPMPTEGDAEDGQEVAAEPAERTVGRLAARDGQSSTPNGAQDGSGGCGEDADGRRDRVAGSAGDTGSTDWINGYANT